jgi:type VI secretion system secreted protein Hcp
MPVDYFLKIDGISGDSTDKQHKDEIQLESFTWGETNSTTGGGGGGGGAGRARMQDFSFTMRSGKASPQLMVACAKGQHLKLATFTARRAGKGQQEFLVIKFSDVVVTSYQTAGVTDTVPLDQVSLAFSKIEMEFRPLKADGTPDTPVKAGWDVQLNKPI